jgi:hypothetical protein
MQYCIFFLKLSAKENIALTETGLGASVDKIADTANAAHI